MKKVYRHRGVGPPVASVRALWSLSSLICAGSALSSPTGKERERTTVVDEDVRKIKEEEPLEMDTIGCMTFSQEFGDSQEVGLHIGNAEGLASCSNAAGGKRNAKISPGGITPSDEDKERGVSIRKNPVVVLRKLRPRKKKPDIDPSFVDLTEVAECSSSSRMSAAAEQSAEEEAIHKRRSKTRKKRSTGKRSNFSSCPSDDGSDSDYIPGEYAALGASAVGAIGLQALEMAENERSISPNIKGEARGRIRRKIKKAVDVINSLMYKAEATGDPSSLKAQNRKLSHEIMELKRLDVVRQREVDDMKVIIDKLKKEIHELRGDLTEAIEDRTKARVCHRTALLKLKKLRNETRGVVPEITSIGIGDGDVKKYYLFDSKGSPDLSKSLHDPVLAERPNVGSKKSGLSSLVVPIPGNEKDEISVNNKQIKGLIKKRVELKRQATSDSGTANDLPMEKPLPQRVPKSKVRITENGSNWLFRELR